MLPVIGKLDESSEKQRAMKEISNPPIGQANIDMGPERWAARKDENNHPDPSIELRDVIKVAYVLRDLCNFISV